MASSFPYHRNEPSQQQKGSDGIPVLAPREGAIQRFSGAGIASSSQILSQEQRARVMTFGVVGVAVIILIISAMMIFNPLPRQSTFGLGTAIHNKNIQTTATVLVTGVPQSPTPVPTATPTPVPTATPTPVPTATPTQRPIATAAPKATSTVTPTNTPGSTATTTAVPTGKPTVTATATSLPTATAMSLPTATATSLPTATPTPVPTATPTPIPTATPTPIPTATPTPIPTATPIPYAQSATITFTKAQQSSNVTDNFSACPSGCNTTTNAYSAPYTNYKGSAQTVWASYPVTTSGSVTLYFSDCIAPNTCLRPSGSHTFTSQPDPNWGGTVSCYVTTYTRVNSYEYSGTCSTTFPIRYSAGNYAQTSYSYSWSGTFTDNNSNTFDYNGSASGTVAYYFNNCKTALSAANTAATNGVQSNLSSQIPSGYTPYNGPNVNIDQNSYGCNPGFPNTISGQATVSVTPSVSASGTEDAYDPGTIQNYANANPPILGLLLRDIPGAAMETAMV